MTIIRKLLSKLFFKIIPPNVLINAIKIEQINQNVKNLTLGKGSKIYSDATVIANSADDIIVGENCRIYNEFKIFNNDGKITIGDNCFIGKNTRIWSAKNVCIGNRVLISHNVNIIDTNAHETNAEERHLNYLSNNLSHNIPFASIMIEDDVWISFNVTILKGIKIGKGSIVGANTVITKDIPPNMLAIGNPTILKEIK